ncbi:DUF6157 family protein [Lacihabitans sp. CS3-21]|jgi:hypothetical protein|uniref:DUF6157 family protein n=1 Tax=Lacihabitans sp. CS3-21 TaxID=2487332 RepID=UPI0020CE0418|nr:DUF6157 family protein [Lacihabitans sp. CS3-21]MCP9746032.1 hypothetical protein [Lacihabitans sp. CS3-21]
MKEHTTNYFNTFIEIAEDCPIDQAEIPPLKGDAKSVANLQFEMINKNPYKFSSDDVLFQVFVDRKEILKEEIATARKAFFSKGQACFRASPLTKRYAWGIHSNSEGKIALIAAGTDEYEKLINDPSLKKYKAMKSKR